MILGISRSFPDLGIGLSLSVAADQQRMWSGATCDVESPITSRARTGMDMAPTISVVKDSNVNMTAHPVGDLRDLS